MAMTDYEAAMVAAAERQAAAWEQLATPGTPPEISQEQKDLETVSILLQKKQADAELARMTEAEATPEIALLESKLQLAYKKRDLKMMMDEGYVENTPENQALVSGTWVASA